ncbi:MAG: chlorophyll synthesis pathway protein BchC [Pseudomonadota bacterium]
MNTLAVVLEAPERLSLTEVDLTPAGDNDVVVDIEWSGISTGTERLLWSGRMPPFPGMGYPLVPGYESVGRVAAAGPNSGRAIGDRVFVPGARCFGNIRGLFGGAAARVVVPGARVVPVGDGLGEAGVLLALAATARHAIEKGGGCPVDLVVGHGVLGRLVARTAIAAGQPAPVVWELDPVRAQGASGYHVVTPEADPRSDYRCIVDVSGDTAVLDVLVQRLAPGGRIVLAGFYAEPVSFAFPPAFMREAEFAIAAQWQPADLAAVVALVESGRLDLDRLISHRRPATDAVEAYATAFGDPACLKMVLDWRRRS